MSGSTTREPVESGPVEPEHAETGAEEPDVPETGAGTEPDTGDGPTDHATSHPEQGTASSSRGDRRDRRSRTERRSGRAGRGRDGPATGGDPTAIPEDLGLGDLLAGALAAYRDI